MSGYHLSEIPKGELGNISKIEEEMAELKDATRQGIKILQLVELADMYGAMEAYLENNFITWTMEDLKEMSDATKRAFKNGGRL